MLTAKLGDTEPGQALLSEAFIQGRRAGNLNLSPSLNPFPDGSAEAEQWRQGRDSALLQRLDPARSWPFK